MWDTVKLTPTVCLCMCLSVCVSVPAVTACLTVVMQ